MYFCVQGPSVIEVGAVVSLGGVTAGAALVLRCCSTRATGIDVWSVGQPKEHLLLSRVAV